MKIHAGYIYCTYDAAPRPHHIHVLQLRCHARGANCVTSFICAGGRSMVQQTLQVQLEDSWLRVLDSTRL